MTSGILDFTLQFIKKKKIQKPEHNFYLENIN